MRHVISPCLALLWLCLLSGCAGNPASGGSAVVFSSTSGEIRIGREAHEKMVSEGALYDSPELQAYINKVGQRLVANSDMPDQTFHFHVIDSQDINAFAMPGGYVYIHRGLLSYLDNEAELAGVLGHEIAHVTARHHGRQKSGHVTSNVIAATVYILTGSGDLADASNIYGQELISGYGREMELEADGLGAQYMYRSGYDPEALLEVIGVLKDHERYQRARAKASGKAAATYHGLFASHPRNDTRLKTVVDAASRLDLDTYIEDPAVPGEFKRLTDGMVWGDSIQGERAENRYYHEKLDFTFELPPGWRVEAGSKAIVARSADNASSLTLTLRKPAGEASSKAVLEDNARGDLSAGKVLELTGIAGYTAVATAGDEARRLAVLDYKGLNYLFEGKAEDFAAGDQALLTMIESFRPLTYSELTVGDGNFLRYIQVPRGATIASLAADSPIEDAEAQLRLINGFYPAGEPRTGDWFKIVE